MKKCFIILTSLMLTVNLLAHPWKPRHFVIIDTDGGIDDMRAITMLLASPDVRVLGIIASTGVLNSDSAYSKVKKLLYTFHHEGIPVAINRSGSFRAPDFPQAKNLSWGNASTWKNGVQYDPINLVSDLLKHQTTKVSFLCLGGLTTPALLAENPAFLAGIKQIIWSSNAGRKNTGFNYSIDRKSADKLFSGKIPLIAVGNAEGKIFYDDNFISQVSTIKNRYSDAITAHFGSPSIRSHEYSFYATDEMIPVFIHYPELFSNSEENHFSPSDEKIQELRSSVMRILSGETVQKNQVIREFPIDQSFYFDDVEPNVTAIIDKYGREEWTSGVIANELHRHLGTYAIIGVKMGIRAREYFNTGVDEFRATSFAGSIPPLSCMNDGVQVSTGATPGHGLLSIINDKPSPSVEFTYMNRKIRLTLKPEIAEKISSELKEINFVYGLDSDIYWELVRKNTIRYWLELDRHEIFYIEDFSPSHPGGRGQGMRSSVEELCL